MIRRFAALGDIHAEDEHLAAALGHIRTLEHDAILAVGDIVDGRGDVDACVRLLRAHRVIAVRGNHDRWILGDQLRTLSHAHHRNDLDDETVAWLGALPPTWTGESVAGTLLLCHGVGDDDMIRLRPDDDIATLAENEPLSRVRASGVQVMVCGHTHRPMVRTIFGLLVVNAGTLHHADNPSFVHVDLEAHTAQTFTIDGSRVIAAETLRFQPDDVWGAF